MDWEDRLCTAPLHPAADTAAMGSSGMLAGHSRAGKTPPLLFHITEPSHGSWPTACLQAAFACCLEGCGGKARCPVGRWMAVLLQGSAHSARGELGTWREAVSGIESEQGVVGREHPAPVEGVEPELCLPVPPTEWFQLF